jgi:hypothetical protein
MGLEAGTYISSLNSSNPAAGDDRSQGDDHLRLIKATILATFPNITGAVTPTHTELNYVDGVTSAIQTQIDGLAGAPRSTTSGTLVVGDKGKCVAVSAGITVPNSTFAAGDMVSIYNDSGSSVTVTQGSGLTLRLGGTATTGNRTLAQRGLCSIWFNTASECVITGVGIT